MLHLAPMAAIPLALWIWASVRLTRAGRILPRKPRDPQRALGIAYLATPLVFGVSGVAEILTRGLRASSVLGVTIPTVWVAALAVIAWIRKAAGLDLLLVALGCLVLFSTFIMVLGGMNLHTFFVAIAEHIAYPPR